MTDVRPNNLTALALKVDRMPDFRYDSIDVFCFFFNLLMLFLLPDARDKKLKHCASTRSNQFHVGFFWL